MARAVFEYAMSADRIDELFRKHAVRQYEGNLLFSTAVDLLGLAVSRSRNSVREAYEVDKEAVGVTIKWPTASVRGPLDCKRSQATLLLYDGVETTSSKG
jgi:hypothetical protein